MLYKVMFKTFLVLCYRCTVLVILVFIGPPTECVLTQARTHYVGIALFVEPCSGSGLYLVLSTYYVVQSWPLIGAPDDVVSNPRHTTSSQPDLCQILIFNIAQLSMPPCSQIGNLFYGNNRIKGKMQLSDLLCPLRLGARRSLHWW